MVHPGGIAILDFGSQYTHLIGNRVRRLGAFSEILPPETPAKDLQGCAGIILSGGPQSVYDKGSPQADPGIFKLGVPILGLCYGLHWMAQTLGGEVKPGATKEYGLAELTTENAEGTPLEACPRTSVVWMSHGDEAKTLPPGFTRIASSADCANAAFADKERKFFAFQFHPEVTHSACGMQMLRSFVESCAPAAWSIENFSDFVGAQVKEEVGDRKVFMLVSGGVDSTVAFTLLNKVLGSERVQGLLVDTGLMRKNEITDIKAAFQKLGITNLHVEDASQEFFGSLAGVTEPEKKRAVIGDTFLAVQKRVSERMKLRAEDGWMLGQGTIYPDTIETGGTKHADKIKTHHNRVEAVQKMIDQGLVVEPLKELYKDEVRMLGEELGLPHELVWRHPFPGPGLGVRILCADAPDEFTGALPDASASVLPVRSVGVQGDNRTYRHALVLFRDSAAVFHRDVLDAARTIPNTHHDFNRVLVCLSHASPAPFAFMPMAITRQRADLLREADGIVHDEMVRAGLYEEIWQFPVVLLPCGREAGKQTIVLRPVASTDAMTAHAPILPEETLRLIVDRILALEEIDTVLYDLTSKPPGTIEWE